MSSRTESIRKCRSVNDIISIVASIASDTKRVRETIKKIEQSVTRTGKSRVNISLSARRMGDQTIELRHGEDNGLKVTKKQGVNGEQLNTPTGHHVLEDYTAPKKDMIEKQADVYQTLHDNISDLNSTEKHLLATITDTPSKKQALNAIRALRSDLESQIDKAFNILTNVGEKHLPKEMRSMFEYMKKFVLKNLDGSTYTKTEDYIVVVPARPLKGVEAQLSALNREVNASRPAYLEAKKVFDPIKADYEKSNKEIVAYQEAKKVFDAAKATFDKKATKTAADNRAFANAKKVFDRVQAAYDKKSKKLDAATNTFLDAKLQYNKSADRYLKAKKRREAFVFDEFQFCAYLEIENLKNSQGWVFEEFYLVLSGIVSTTGTMRIYVDALPNFVAPGNYHINEERTIKAKADLEHRIRALLAANDIAPEFERRPMPLETRDLASRGFTKIPGVKSVEVDDDMLTVTLTTGKDSPTVINTIVSAVAPLLRHTGLQEKGGRASNVQWSKTKDSKGVQLHFVLTGTARKANEQRKQYTFDAAKLSELQHILELSPEQVKEIKKAMRKFI